MAHWNTYLLALSQEEHEALFELLQENNERRGDRYSEEGPLGRIFNKVNTMVEDPENSPVLKYVAGMLAQANRTYEANIARINLLVQDADKSKDAAVADRNEMSAYGYIMFKQGLERAKRVIEGNG